jgi:hypothetical protein
MPKTLDTQGFSGLREEVVRSEGRSSRPPVLQAITITAMSFISPPVLVGRFFIAYTDLEIIFYIRGELVYPGDRVESVSEVGHSDGILSIG